MDSLSFGFTRKKEYLLGMGRALRFRSNAATLPAKNAPSKLEQWKGLQDFLLVLRFRSSLFVLRADK